MTWTIEFSGRVTKDLKGMDRATRARVLTFIHSRLAALDDPRSIGEALKGNRLGDLWKYRVGNWRVIARIEDARLVVAVVRIGHRREVYRP